MVEISIIVPVYNVECYLRKCMESILNQTFQNFEVILVDDGSFDRSGEICNEYASKNESVIVIHKENEGVSSARNCGLNESTGDLITFVDPDDWIEKHYLEVLYNCLKKNHADLVLSGGIDVLECQKISERKMDLDGTISEAEIISKPEAYKRMFICEKNFSVVTWAKLYSKKLFKEVRYPIGEISEDSKVISRIIEGCNKIVCTSYSGYYHLRRRGSLMHRKMSTEYKVCIKNAKYLWDFISEKYPGVEDAVKVFYYNNCIQLINLMVLDYKRSYEKECNILQHKILKEKKFLILSRYTKLEEKCAVICLIFGIPMYRIIWRSYLWMTKKDSGTII